MLKIKMLTALNLKAKSLLTSSTTLLTPLRSIKMQVKMALNIQTEEIKHNKIHNG